MRKLLLLIGAIGVLGSLLLVTLIASPSPVVRFRTFYDSLTPGMTEEKVLSSLHNYFPQGGRLRTPQLRRWEKGLHFILDPSDGRYDSEVITLTFDAKYTVAKVYLPD